MHARILTSNKLEKSWEIFLQSLQLHAVRIAVAQLLQEAQLELERVFMESHLSHLLGAIVHIQLLCQAP